jgi:hypothetical protein
MELSDSLCSLARPGSHFSVRSSTSGKPFAYGPSAPSHVGSGRGAFALDEEERTMEGKEELLKLAHKQLDQAAKLLKAADEELLALEAEALAVRVDLPEAALHPLLP